MKRLEVGDRAKIIDAPESQRHVVGQTGSVVSSGGTRDEQDIVFRTDLGKMILGRRHQFLWIGQAGDAGLAMSGLAGSTHDRDGSLR